MNRLDTLRNLHEQNSHEEWQRGENNPKHLVFWSNPYRFTTLLAQERRVDYVLAMHEAMPDLLRVVDLARTIAHEHPDENWGYDGAGIHCYDGEVMPGCTFCEALAQLERGAS